MNRSKLFAPALAATVGLAAVVGSFALAGQSSERKPADQQSHQQMQLPPGWTEADMQACMIAGTPGKMHEYLAEGVGTWEARSTMWMYPGADPMKSQGTATAVPMMDGRFILVEHKGEMPGAGPFHGAGVYGYDNVAGQFVSSWVDNMSTGIMNGTGELSSDGKTLTWNFSYMCPLTKKPCVLREVETVTGPDTKTLEMFSTDPKSGKEYRMMLIEFTKKS